MVFGGQKGTGLIIKNPLSLYCPLLNPVKSRFGIVGTEGTGL